MRYAEGQVTKRRSRFLPWIVFFLSAGLAVLAWWQMRTEMRQNDNRRIEQLTGQLIFIGGLLASVLGALLTWALVNARGRALELAARVTAEPRRTEGESRRLAMVASRTANAVLLADPEKAHEGNNGSFHPPAGYNPD